MPFLEVLIFDQHEPAREMLSRRLTDALAQAYGIEPGIISIYFRTVDARAYAHAGTLAPSRADQRVFIKLHAFRRAVVMRRAAAAAIAAAAVDVLGTSPKNIILYFFDREPNEVAHAGQLAGD